MKIAPSVLLALCVSSAPLFADPSTAYQALRIVGRERGDDSLKHVVEVEGRGGVPQPYTWRVVLDDPSARGGVREIDIANGKIVSEHTPINAYGGSPQGSIIDFKKLNLDSSGAFTVAEKQAEKAHVGFDTVDYTLRTGDGPEGNPVWVIHMMNSTRRSIGTLTLGADSGAIVASDFSGTAPVPPPEYTGPANPPPPPDAVEPDPDHDNLYNPGAEPPPVRQADDSDTEDTQGLRVGHRIKKAFLSAGQSLKNFITGNSDR